MQADECHCIDTGYSVCSDSASKAKKKKKTNLGLLNTKAHCNVTH